MGNRKLCGVAVSSSGTLHQDGLGVVGEHLHPRVGFANVVPSLQIELRFGRPRRPGVERHRPVQRRIPEEEREPHRYLEDLPVPPIQREVRECEVAVRYGAIAQLGLFLGEQQIAASTDAHQLPDFDIDHVLVLIGDVFCTHLAPLTRRLRRRFGGPDAG